MKLMKKKTNKYRFLSCILGLFMLLSVIGVSNVPVVNAETSEETSETDDDEKVIRVGYAEIPVYQVGASDDAIKSGYNYDYLQKVASYTGWKYEYVYGNRKEMYDKLCSGEIDILAGIGYSKDRDSKIGFPSYSMGYTTFCLFTLNSNSDMNDSLYGVSGKKIGVCGETAFRIATNWLDTKGLTAEVVFYETVEARDEALYTGKVAYCIEEAGYYDSESLCSTLCVVAREEKYLGVSKKRQDLLWELNGALAELAKDEPFYIDSLSSFYSTQNGRVNRISQRERNWLNDHSIIRVGYLKNYMPFCGTDENGKSTGVLADTLELMMSNLGISTAVLQYRDFDDSYEMVDALENGEVDVIFPMPGYLWDAEQAGVVLSNGVITTSMTMVWQGKYEEGTKNVIAVNKHNLMQIEYVKHNIPEATLYECDSIEGCLDAVLAGHAGSTVVNSLRLSEILSQEKYYRLTYLLLPDDSERCFAVSRENAPLVSLLNRGLANLPQNYALTASYEYSKQKKYTFEDFMKEHMILILFIAFLCFFLIATGFAIAIVKSKKEVLLKKVLREDNLTKLHNRFAYEEELHRHMHAEYKEDQVYITADVNGLKRVNDSLGHGAGDELIRGVAACLKKTFPDEDRMYRIGGDEFTIVLNMSKEDAEKKITELRECVYRWRGVKVNRLSLSLGVAYRCEHEDESVRELVRMADLMMYDDKRRFYDEEGADRRGSGRRASDLVEDRNENDD